MDFFSWWYGVVGLSIPLALLYVFITTHISFVAITLYLHRHSAHRALDLHPAVRHFFRFVLWISTGMVTKEWTAVHRCHHANTETKLDPHSPVVHGLGKILFQGTEYYREASTDPELLERYGKGTPDDWLERNIYAKRNLLGISILAAVDLLLFGIIGVIVWAIQMIWTPFWAAGVINGIGHAIGYRNFESPDVSKNIVPFGVFICGEELHNNHHTYPNSARFSVKPWEFDLGWQYIRLLTFLKLAKPLHTGPVTEKVSGKSIIDADTLWAVVNDRFQVMARYAEDVVKPVIQQEKQSADGTLKKLLRRAQKILCSHELVLRSQELNRLEEIMQHSPLLKHIYDMRIELNEVWSKRSGNAEELMSAFVDWCTSAEATGLEVLRSFVAELKTYTVPKSASVTS